MHANAKLGLAGRHALVSGIAGGLSIRAAAVAFNVSPATAHRWWRRWSRAGSRGRVRDITGTTRGRQRSCPGRLERRLSIARVAGNHARDMSVIVRTKPAGDLANGLGKPFSRRAAAAPKDPYIPMA